jgi:Fe2+ transport system protein FeoA
MPNIDSQPAFEDQRLRPVPLSTLRGGDRGRLHLAELPCDECELLQAMGLTDQCEVRVCRGGEPCIVQVHATRLGLSASLARRIYVTVNGRA